MNKKIYKQIKKYDNIVLARHINVDPDAMSSVMALKESINITFPEKKVYTIGTGPSKFNYIGKLNKNIDFSTMENVLLILVDTPDKKRADELELVKYDYSIKIDHHPYIEPFCDLELIDDTKSSAAEMVYDLISKTKLKMNKKVAEILFYGIVADTGRFMFNNATPTTFRAVANLIDEYNLDITKLYYNLYRRPFNELQLQAYMTNNMKITENGVGYVKITNEVMEKFKIDSTSCGDSINEFNHIDELLVWISAREDVKNNCIRISMRSRGPVINKIAERYNGGGHKAASGARVPSFEEVDLLIKDLDKLCDEYIKGCEDDED